MIRLLTALIAVGVLGAIGIWLSPKGLLEDLMMIVVSIDLLILLFACTIGLLQRLSPPETES